MKNKWFNADTKFEFVMFILLILELWGKLLKNSAVYSGGGLAYDEVMDDRSRRSSVAIAAMDDDGKKPAIVVVVYLCCRAM